MSDCIFCRIVSNEIPAREVARSADAVAFYDLSPQAPVHVLVIPTTHVDNAAGTNSDAGERLMGRTLRFAVQVADQLGLTDQGYRLVMNTGPNGGQSVGHLHVHLLGGRGMKWPPG